MLMVMFMQKVIEAVY